MTRAGDEVQCPHCESIFRATKHRKRYCGPACADEARKIRQREAKRRQRGGTSWEEYLERTGKQSRK
jgi:hypothetical protein